jgi:hypothetical protein
MQNVHSSSIAVVSTQPGSKVIGEYFHAFKSDIFGLIKETGPGGAEASIRTVSLITSLITFG